MQISITSFFFCRKMGFSLEKLCLITVIVIMVTLRETVASVHKVGGSAGWTILNKVDYNKWTSSDTFTAGDSLLFVYNTQFHNVKQVSRHDFLSCNATSAIATYTSGSDVVVLTRPGHFYFLCGFPGHCQGGQKLHVLVGSDMISPTPSPSPSTGSSSSPATASRDSTENGAVSLPKSTSLTLTMSGVVLFLVALLLY